MLRNATDQLVIKPRLSSMARLFIAVAAIVVVVGASIAGYLGGRGAVQVQLDSRAQEIERLQDALQESREERAVLESDLDGAQQKLAEMRRKLDETRSNLTKVTRQLQIDQTAYSELREQLRDSNQQITRLGSELQFYRSIISPSDGESGVKVQELRLEPTEADRQYRYHLTLIQALDHENAANGVVRFEIEGVRQGDDQTVRIPADGDDLIAAKFKYFQNLEGTFTLPEGFKPAGIRVIFQTDDGTADRDYPWPLSEARQGS